MRETARSKGLPMHIYGPETGQEHRDTLQPLVADYESDHQVENFTAATRCVVYGLQHRAVQGTLDIDYQIKTIAIIVEDVPESQTWALNKEAHKRGVGIIGLATVGGIKVRACNFTSSRALAYSHCLNHSSISCLSLATFALDTQVVCSTISSCPNSMGQVRSRMSRNLDVCPLNSTISFVAFRMEYMRAWPWRRSLPPVTFH